MSQLVTHQEPLLLRKSLYSFQTIIICFYLKEIIIYLSFQQCLQYRLLFGQYV